MLEAILDPQHGEREITIKHELYNGFRLYTVSIMKPMWRDPVVQSHTSLDEALRLAHNRSLKVTTPTKPIIWSSKE